VVLTTTAGPSDAQAFVYLALLGSTVTRDGAPSPWLDSTRLTRRSSAADLSVAPKVPTLLRYNGPSFSRAISALPRRFPRATGLRADQSYVRRVPA